MKRQRRVIQYKVNVGGMHRYRWIDTYINKNQITSFLLKIKIANLGLLELHNLAKIMGYQMAIIKNNKLLLMLMLLL